MDRVSVDKRSAIMRSVKSQHTTPEILLRKSVWSIGLRGWRKNYSKLTGKPDLVFTKLKLAIFVDGCFWHGCPNCCRMPSSNSIYWKNKIDKNTQRDIFVTQALLEQSWNVIRFWEHEVVHNASDCALQIKQRLEALALLAITID